MPAGLGTHRVNTPTSEISAACHIERVWEMRRRVRLNDDRKRGVRELAALFHNGNEEEARRPCLSRLPCKEDKMRPSATEAPWLWSLQQL
jgi:hypothetical protein